MFKKSLLIYITVSVVLLAGCSSATVGASSASSSAISSIEETFETQASTLEPSSIPETIVIISEATSELATESVISPTTESESETEIKASETSTESNTITEITTEMPTEAPAPAPTEAPTQPPAEIPSQSQAEVITEAQTEPPTQISTETLPTEPPTIPTQPETISPATESSSVVTNGPTVSLVSYGGVLYLQGSAPIVCIDPGHMGQGSSAKEPNGPGSTVMKARATYGTAGCVSRVKESIINLQVSLQLRDVLLSRGYSVLMTRETENVDISNMERALMANEVGAAINVRIHCNSINDQSITGILTMSPTAGNPYVGYMFNECYNLSNIILAHSCATTGAASRGILQNDTMTGINWCKMPVTIIEMGFMSNPTEDQLLCDAGYQAKMVQGIANGIDAYFGR